MRELIINENISSEKLTVALNKVQTELVNSKKNLLIEKIKKTIIEYVYYSDKQIKTNFSDYLSEKLDYHYTYMANLFSKINGSSIQNFIITTKIERAKELLIYENLTLTKVAYKLHYSSVAHLSNQFKKVTGVNPSQFLASKLENMDNFPKIFHAYTDSAKNEPVIFPLNSIQMPPNFEEQRQQMKG